VTIAPSEATTRDEPTPNTEVGVPLVVIVGNPNVGKTTLYNRLTGERARIGNYPGVTVERRSGRLRLADGRKVELVDLPGAYSLSARSAEEQIALEAVVGLDEFPQPSLCVVVVDAGQLTRNLYLVLQLAELGVPLVIALNMMDEVSDNPPNAAALERHFGVPVVPTNGRLGTGTGELTSAIMRALDAPRKARIEVPYPRELVADADRVAEALPAAWRGTVERDRALSLWALASIDDTDELANVPTALRERTDDVRAVASKAADRDLDREIVAARYALLDAMTPDLYAKVERHPPKRKASERVDRVLLHPVGGFFLFLAIMLVVFQALFSWSDPAISLIEDLMSALAGVVSAILPSGLVHDLVTEGVIGGVGNVVVFLPQILLLFFFIGLLEDSGYMARVAFLMDRVLRSLGLHGRAFVPMLSGFACAVPAILATRTMEQKRDRLLTMLVIPLMTCSARLPVYTLIIAALFPPTKAFGWLPVQGLLMVSMYVFAIVTTLFVAFVLGRTVVRGRRVPLILELPPYRLPSLRTTLRMMGERSFVFLKEAGTVILACTVVLWALLSFPRNDAALEAAPRAEAAEVSAPRAPVARSEAELAELRIEQSYGGRLGKALEPVLAPLGFDWKLGVGILGAFAAREVFVSTLGLVYGAGAVDDEAIPLRQKLREETKDGLPRYTPLVGLSLLVFFALSCQCMSTLAVVRRETKTWRWPAFMFAYMTVLAYCASLLVYQGGRLLGFS
jgi:ferrous iron transport protein B